MPNRIENPLFPEAQVPVPGQSERLESLFPEATVPDLPGIQREVERFDGQSFNESYGSYDDKAKRAIGMYKQAHTDDPDRWAQLKQKSIETGLSVYTLSKLPDLGVLDKVSTNKIRSNKTLIDYYAGKIENAGISYNDVDKLHEIARLSDELTAKLADRSTGWWADVVGRPLAAGMKQNVQGRLAFQHMLDLPFDAELATTFAPKDMDREDIIQMFSEDLKYSTIRETEGASSFISEAARIAGQVGEAFGSRAALPSIIGAKFGPLGWAKGAFIGYMENTFEVETGHAWLDFRDIETEEGDKLDPSLAVTGALMVGTANTVVEGAMMLVLGKAFKMVPGSEKITSKFLTKVVGSSLKKEGFRALLAQSGKAYALGVGTEVTEETVQEILPMAIEWMITHADEIMSDTKYPDQNAAENLAQIGQVALKTFKGTLTLGFVPMGVNTMVQVQKLHQAQELREKMLSLKEVVDSTETEKKSPQAMRELLEGLDQTVQVDAKGLMDLIPDMPDGLANLGLSPEQVGLAAEDGRTVDVSSADMLAFLTGKEYSGLVNIIKTDSFGYTAEEAETIHGNDVVEETLLTLESESMEEIQFHEQLAVFYKEMVEAGIPATEADSIVELWSAFSRRWGKEGHALGDTLAHTTIQRAKDPEAGKEKASKFLAKEKEFEDYVTSVAPTVAYAEEIGLVKVDPAFAAKGDIASSPFLSMTRGTPMDAVAQALGIEEQQVFDDLFNVSRKSIRDQYRLDKADEAARYDALEAEQLRKEADFQVDAESQPARTPEQIARYDAEEAAFMNSFSQDENGITRGRVYMADDKYIIQLFDKADMSTILHESAHVFMREMQGLVEAGEASAELAKDWATLQESVGTEGELTVEMQEKLAKSFELYLREGKAPSTALRSAFRRFKRWLQNIYKSVSQLGVELTDDVRSVFDRLLITENQTEAAALEGEITILSDGEMNALGIAEGDKAYLRGLIDTSKNRAEDRVQENKQKNIAGQRKIWLRQAQNQVAGEQVYITRDDLLNNGGLNAFELEDLFGKEVVANLRLKHRRFVKKGGRTIEEVASANGYESVADFVTALQESVTKEQRVQQIIDKKIYESDMAYSTSAQEFAESTSLRDYLDAIGKFIAKLVEKHQPRASINAIKASVAQKLMVMPVKKSIETHKFMGALRNAQRAMRNAIAKGDYVAALEANQQTLVLHEFANQSRALRKDIEGIIRRVKKISKAKPGVAIEGSYLLNIKVLAARFGLGSKKILSDTAAMENRKTLREQLSYDPELLDVGTIFGDWLLDETLVVNYKDLTVDHLLELDDMLKLLNGRGRDLVAGLNSARTASIKEIAKDISENAEKRLKRDKRVFTAGSIYAKVFNPTRAFFANTDQLLFIMQSLDGFVSEHGKKGPAELNIYDPLAKAYSARMGMFKEIEAKLVDPLKHIQKVAAKAPKVYTQFKVPEIMTKAYGGLQMWTFERIFAVALNMGTEGNRQAIYDGYGMTKKAVDTMLSEVLTKEDMLAIQEIWEVIGGLWPEMNRVFNEVNHYKQVAVPASAYTIKTKDGKTVTLKGGYFPLKFDKSLTGQKDWDIIDDIANSTNAMFAVPSTKSGSMQKRVGSGGLAPRLAFSVISQHLNDAVQYITHTQTISDVYGIMKNQDFKNTVEKKLGQDVYKYLIPALRNIARADAEFMNFMDDMSSHMRTLTTTYTLGANLRVALKQPYSLLSFMSDHGVWTLAKGFAGVARHPFEAREMMHDLSPLMRNRSRNMDREAREILSQMKFGKGYAIHEVRKASMALIRWADFMAVYPAWWGAYQKGLKKFKGDIKQAAFYADEQGIARSQPITRQMDKSEFQRSTTGITRMFTMFMTFTMRQGNRMRFKYNAWRNGSINTYEYMRSILYEQVAPPLLMRTMFSLMWGVDFDDDELLGDAASDLILYQFSGMPYIRDIMSGVVSAASTGRKAGFSLPTLQGAEHFMNFGGALLQIAADLEDDSAMEAAGWGMLELLSFETGIPASKVIKRWIQGVHEIESGKGTFINPLIPSYKK